MVILNKALFNVTELIKDLILYHLLANEYTQFLLGLLNKILQNMSYNIKWKLQNGNFKINFFKLLFFRNALG